MNALKDDDLQKAKDLLVQALSPLVHKPADELLFEIEKNATFADGRPRRFMWLAKEVDEDFYNRFQELKAKLKDESREAEKISNVSVVQPATFDPKPVKPNTLLALALGLVVAAGAAVGLAALLDHRAARPAAGRPADPLVVALAVNGRTYAQNGHPGIEEVTR